MDRIRISQADRSLRLKSMWPTLLVSLLLSACGTQPLMQPTVDTDSKAVIDTEPETSRDNQAADAPSPARPLSHAEASPPVGPPDNHPGVDTYTPAPDDAAASRPEEDRNDVWTRVRSGFTLGGKEHPAVEKALLTYAAEPQNLTRILDRAHPYLYHIVNEVEGRGLPTEIALLPAIESAFRPFAHSSEHAAGLWQFIPSTGRHFGLRRNWWYDGRRDLLASTDAALDYLQALHRRFNGDWTLALAAYNAGQGTVGRALRRNLRNNEETDVWALRLPRETRQYVPRLLAMSKIVADPGRYGVMLRPIPNQPQFTTVDIGSQLDLGLAAELAEMPVDELYRLNPGFNRWATAPNGPHRLLLPNEKVELFVARLADLEPEQRMRWRRYVIKKGDTLSVIARNHGVSVTHLKQANRLRNTRIYAGRQLLIPTVIDDKLPAPVSLMAGKSKQRRGPISYTVRPGDTLWDIGRTHRVSYLKLAKWNGLEPDDTLRPKQRLLIWGR